MSNLKKAAQELVTDINDRVNTLLGRHLKGLYTLPKRAYHNWGHVEHCLKELESYPIDKTKAALLTIALMYHDAIYDPHDPYGQYHEYLSSLRAEQDMLFLGISEEKCAVIARLILCTSHAKYPLKDPDERLMCDIDLTIFGQPWEKYQEYADAIRQEYSFVSDQEYATGRKKVLSKFMERPRIFQTDFFYDKYEAQARANLLKELNGFLSHERATKERPVEGSTIIEDLKRLDAAWGTIGLSRPEYLIWKRIKASLLEGSKYGVPQENLQKALTLLRRGELLKSLSDTGSIQRPFLDKWLSDVASFLSSYEGI